MLSYFRRFVTIISIANTTFWVYYKLILLRASEYFLKVLLFLDATLVLKLPQVFGVEKASKIIDFYEVLKRKYTFLLKKWKYWRRDIALNKTIFTSITSKIWKYSFRSFLFVVAYLFLVSTNFLWLTGKIPSVNDLQNPKLNQASELYTEDGVLFGKFFSENRVPVKNYSDLSPNLIHALVSTEDERYFSHSGMDFKALIGVAFGVVTGNNRGGGSTISQQLAKNLFRTRTSYSKGLLGQISFIRKFNYKLKEWITAVRLEQNYTKEEILVMYLNTVDFGSNSYGIKVASKTYFNTTPDSLSIQEAAVLVGIQKATTTYNPKLNYNNSFERRNVVLAQMVKNNFISKAAFDSISKLPINLESYKVETPYEGTGNYFKNAVVAFLRDWAKENNKDLNLYGDGLKIYTTIDSRMQAYAEAAVKEKMKINQKRFNGYWGDKNPWTDAEGVEIPNFIEDIAKRTDAYKILKKKFKGNLDSINHYMNLPHKIKVFTWNGGFKIENFSAIDSIKYYKKLLQTGMMSMDPYNGQIKAWVGGLDYNFFKYDHVKQSRRQPGSTFKPIVYAAALDGPFGLSPCYKVQDRPFRLKYRENQEDKVWEPKNADGRFSWSHYTIRKAIAKSVNSVAVALTMKMGKITEDAPTKKINKFYSQEQYDMEQGAEIVISCAKKLGVKSPLEPIPALSLGAFDVNLHEMVAAYAVFLNNGIYTEPQIVTRIEDRNGKLLYEFKPKTRKAISRESAFLMTYMLRGGVEEAGGTSKGLFNYDLFPKNTSQMAGKTGTTSNYSDAWYIGMSHNLVTGVWVGGDDRCIHFRGTMGEGSQVALPIFGRYMELVFKDKKLPYKAGSFPKPSFPIELVWEDCSKWVDPYAPKPDTSRVGVRLDSLSILKEDDAIELDTSLLEE